MTDQAGPPVRYHAFLLRFWQNEEPASWRASLEDPHSGTTRGFASMEALFIYLDSFTSGNIESNLNDGNTTQSAEG